MKKHFNLVFKSKNPYVRKMHCILTVAFILFIALEFVKHPHPYFDMDKIPLFYLGCGIAGGIFAIIVGRFVGIIVGRKESYYEK